MLSDTYALRLPHPSLLRRPNTLLGGTLTLFALKNSLFARPGNFPAKSLADRLFCGLRHANSVGNRQNSLFLPCLTGNLGFRDGFARDCVLHQRVSCEPDFLDQEAVS